MDSLRKRVVRVAHTQPALRKHLLPLLRSAGRSPYQADPWAPDPGQEEERVSDAQTFKANAAKSMAFYKKKVKSLWPDVRFERAYYPRTSIRNQDLGLHAVLPVSFLNATRADANEITKIMYADVPDRMPVYPMPGDLRFQRSQADVDVVFLMD